MMDQPSAQPEPEPGPDKIQYLFNRFAEYCKKDLFVILICLLTILACIITFANIQHVTIACNDFYQDQMQRCNCGLHTPTNYTPTIQFTLTGGIINASTD